MPPLLSLRNLTTLHHLRLPFRPCRPLWTTPPVQHPRTAPPPSKKSSYSASSTSTSASSKKKKRKGRAPQIRSPYYEKVRILTRNMFSPAPPPLRMARLRHLRHWTIHRAWQLFRRKYHERLDHERHRLHAAMYYACEELRRTSGPGNRSEGSLYRVAMLKIGVWAGDTIPIEYARLQTETPAREAWNHDWKR
ncbi:hypothetical protein XA68_15608 [Ophiocordyceps unilateralis]|uniref:Uncharacterized protein n=1 Tax=Ophiocordyceps unilateralis TaxID=268505 RepID=A0A2A9P6F8_OPHUN|nr:hypothetical protein XA68_15608 [Ophiocordyceps unilateralis]